MLVKASSVQRFVAYLIDIFIINYVASLLCSLVYLLTGDIGAIINKYYTEMYNIVMQAQSSGNIDTDLFYQAFSLFIQYSLLDLAIFLPIVLVLDILYLVILPKKCQFQTIGRLVASCKVVALDNNLSYKKLILREIVGTFIFYQVLGSIGIIISLVLVLTRGYSITDSISKCALVKNVIVRRVPRDDYNNSSNYKDDDYVDATFKDVSDNEYKKDDNYSNEDDDYRII